jgi:glutathione S-transferase
MSHAPQTKYELLYFPIHGRAEVLRLTFALAQVEFVDVAVTDWATLKPQTPLGQVPVLKETTGDTVFQIPQSAAILRHLGRVFQLYGANEREHTIVDYVLESAIDWRSKFTPVAYARMYGTAQQVVDKYYNEDLPHHLRLMNLLLASSAKTGSFFAGNTPTIADIAVWDCLDAHLSKNPKVLENHAPLHDFYERVKALPGVAAHLSRRRPSEHAS